MVCVGQSPLQPMRYSFWSIAILLPLVLAASVEHQESKGGGAMSAWPNFFTSKVSLPLNFILMVNTAGMREFQIRFTWDPGLSFWHRLHHPFGQQSLPEVGQGEGGRQDESDERQTSEALLKFSRFWGLSREKVTNYLLLSVFLTALLTFRLTGCLTAHIFLGRAP